MKRKKKAGIILLGIIAAVLFLSYSLIPFLARDSYSRTAVLSQAALASTSEIALVQPAVPAVTHIATPKEVKAIYMTSCVVGTPSLRAKLVAIADATEINSIVIDVKDFSGALSFKPDDSDLAPYVSKNCGARDMKDFVKTLHDKNIYVIGRVTVFQDPLYTKLHPETAIKSKSKGVAWKDFKGISYIDPASKTAWDHVLAIATAAHDIGFDEINFDYVRYPSDGPISDISIPQSAAMSSKPAVLESFFSYLHSHLAPLGIVASADLFGMTTTNYDDLGIGQVLERAEPYFDFIDPMVYPSHYPPNFNGWKNPNLYSYDLIHYVLKTGVARTVASSSPIDVSGSVRIGTTTLAHYTKEVWPANKIRPWLQDFNYGGIYTAKEVREQIQATYDDGLNSWLIWDPANHYSPGAFLPEATTSVSSSVL